MDHHLIWAYHGKQFEGNEVTKLLNNTSKIRSAIEDNLHIFVDTMESLKEVKDSCFGYTLKDDYKVKIQKLKDDWTQLNLEFGVPVTNKCHIIFEHLEDFIETQRKPLGEFSEQVVEAAHQKLDKIWQFYIVKMVETEDHGLAFEKCVNHFNSMNVM